MLSSYACARVTEVLYVLLPRVRYLTPHLRHISGKIFREMGENLNLPKKSCKLACVLGVYGKKTTPKFYTWCMVLRCY